MALCAFFAAGLCSTAKADRLRNVKHGEKVPDFEVNTFDGRQYSSKFSRGKVLVVIYLSAKQKSSERVAADAQRIISALKRKDLELVFVTADIVHKAYFTKLWKELGIKALLGMDTGRKYYAKLGLIVFPTTIIIDKKGRLDHVLATRGTNYAFLLEAFAKHSLGILDDAALRDHLKVRSFKRGLPRSIASRHRAAARLLREKGILKGAEKELRKDLEFSPKDLQIKLDLADLLFEEGMPAQAEKIIDAVLLVDPRHRRAKMLKGIAYFKAKEFKKAEGILLEALILNPDPARTHYFLGRIYEQTGKKDKALKHYRESIQRLLKRRSRN
jgi:tetratricopeptide (TPR) repeat protein